MNLHLKSNMESGYNSLVDSSNEFIKFIEFGIINLSHDSLALKNSNVETVLVILSGECKIKCGKNGWGLKRKDVFSELASAVYIPPGTDYEISTESRIELAVCSALIAKSTTPAQMISSNKVKSRVVGKDNWQRTVYDIIGLDFPAKRLILGETINPPGNWSSYPPHKHDEMKPPDET